MNGYPTGSSIAELDRAQGDIGHDPNEWQAARERLAEQDFADWCEGFESEGARNIRDWLMDNAWNYVEAMHKGGDSYHAAKRDLERDALAWLAETMDDDRIRAEIWL